MPMLLTRKSLQNDLAFVERQLAQHPDPYDTVRLMWEQRRDALREELADSEERHDSRAHVALLFDGNPVLGSEEIRLDFATKALENYQSFVSSLVAEGAGAELGARGRLPVAFASKLFIRDMVRGSVGFLLEEPQGPQYDLTATALHEAVQAATRILRVLSSSERQNFDDQVTQLTPRTLAAIKRMTKVLHDADAETTIVGDVEEFTLDRGSTASLYMRLRGVEVLERREKREGILLGLFPERQQYEFRPADGSPVFYGPVSETLDAKYLTDPAYARSIILRPASATFNVASTIRAGVLQREQWILEEIAIAGSV
jgi:hypothetical protein